MRAKSVNENISFERGKSPKSVLTVGNPYYGVKKQIQEIIDEYNMLLHYWSQWRSEEKEFINNQLQKTTWYPNDAHPESSFINILYNSKIRKGKVKIDIFIDYYGNSEVKEWIMYPGDDTMPKEYTDHIRRVFDKRLEEIKKNK